MAVYRNVHISFWTDPFVLDLTPEEKYFFLYLMTNSKTTQIGIYELPKTVIQFETGYNRDTVDKLLSKFMDYGKLKYDQNTKEVMLTNWLKYNLNNSPKVIACVEKELKNIKSESLKNEFHTVCKQYQYSIDTSSQKEKEEEQEKEQTVIEEFERFWFLFDKKVGKKKCLKKWKKISKDNKENPHTYLNNESWEDEIVTDTGNGSETSNEKSFSDKILVD